MESQRQKHQTRNRDAGFCLPESVCVRGFGRASTTQHHYMLGGGRLHPRTSCRDSFHDLKPANLILVDVEHVDIGAQAPGCAPGKIICLLQGFWQLWVDVARHYPALEIPLGSDQEALFSQFQVETPITGGLPYGGSYLPFTLCHFILRSLKGHGPLVSLLTSCYCSSLVTRHCSSGGHRRRLRLQRLESD